MKINDDQIDRILILLSNQNIRQLMRKISKTSGFTYTELITMMGYRNPHIYTDEEKTKKPSVLAYYVKKLIAANMLKKDEVTKRYFLTRFGIQAFNLFENFEKICVSYDMSDVGADGKIKIVAKVIGRKKK